MRSALILLSFAAACGSKAPATSTTTSEPTKPVSADEAPAKMDSFTMNGFTLTGAEYWPYVGAVDIKYPEEVLWGFYPEQGVVPPGEEDPNPATARPEAVACAKQAWDALRGFVKSGHPKLLKIVALGEANGTIVPRFYLWTNDYGRAADPYPPGVREARLWWWARKKPEPPRPPGYWKWESTLTQKGECLIPRSEQIESYLTEMLAKMETAVDVTAKQHDAR